MKDILTSQIFAVLITLIAYEIGLLINRKTKISLFNPLLIGIIIIIGVLCIFKIDVEDYNKGGQLISLFLAPATVVLAVPLYKKINLLKENLVPILVGIFTGCVVNITSVILLSKVFKLDQIIILSLVPKSVTTPIGIEISKQLGGILEVTVTSIVLTGILGAIIAPTLLKALRIKDKVAIGIAIGTSSHVGGTSKAVEMGETEGAMSGLAIGVAGLITVIITPFVVKVFDLFGIL